MMTVDRPYLHALELYGELGSYRRVAEQLTEQGCRCSHETVRTWVRVGREARRIADEQALPRQNATLRFYAQVIAEEAARLLRCVVCHELKAPSEFRKRLVKRGARGLGVYTSSCRACRVAS